MLTLASMMYLSFSCFPQKILKPRNSKRSFYAKLWTAILAGKRQKFKYIFSYVVIVVKKNLWMKKKDRVGCLCNDTHIVHFDAVTSL